MKLLITLSFTLLIFSGFALAKPVSTFARADDYVTVCHKGNTITFDRSALPAHLRMGDTVGACPPVSVPEFGVIPGAVAALSSGGAFLYLKKKKYN